MRSFPGTVGFTLFNITNMCPEPHALPPPATPPRRPPKRSHQVVGAHFESPKRRRPMRKDSAIVIRPGLARREQELSSRLDTLLGRHKAFDAPIEKGSEPADSVSNYGDLLADSETVESAQLAMPENGLDSMLMSPPNKKPAPSQSSAPSKNAQQLYDNWVSLLPTVEGDYLCYMQSAQGRLGRPLQGEPHRCITSRCVIAASAVQCLYADRRFCSALIPSN